MKKDWKVWLLMALGAVIGGLNGADFASKIPEQIRNVTGKQKPEEQPVTEKSPEGE